ncbi:MAG: hypothetical protein KAI17_04180 [Thiotrichaceae bacterium]|nr:hypothetical protein [Thiotrichaceae bacterium]
MQTDTNKNALFLDENKQVIFRLFKLLRTFVWFTLAVIWVKEKSTEKKSDSL